MKLAMHKYRTTTFCTVAPNICRPSVWHLFHFTPLAPVILRWVLGFQKVCAPLYENGLKRLAIHTSLYWYDHLTVHLSSFVQQIFRGCCKFLLAYLGGGGGWGGNVGYSGRKEYELRADFSILSLILVWSHTAFSGPTFFFSFPFIFASQYGPYRYPNEIL